MKTMTPKKNQSWSNRRNLWSKRRRRKRRREAKRARKTRLRI
jgi:hypothetical protein